MPAKIALESWQIYEKSLINVGRGLPLWEPSPSTECERAWPGHVGYIKHGRFVLLFDAGQEINGRIRGRDVPHDFSHPVVLGSIRPLATLRAGKTASYGLKYGSESEGSMDAPTPFLQVSAKFSISTTGEFGAYFFSQGRTFRRDTERTGNCKRYMKENYRSWLKFAQDTGHEVDLGNLVLITGVDLAKDFHQLVYQKSRQHTGLELSVETPDLLTADIGASLKHWRHREVDDYSDDHDGPDNAWSPLQPNERVILDQTAPEDHADLLAARQSIFLRRVIIQDRIFWINMKAAAGPDILPPGDPSSGDNGIGMGITRHVDVDVVDSDLPRAFLEPLQPCIDYIFSNSNATVAMVHDLDYAALLAQTDPSKVSSMEVADVLKVTQPTAVVDADGVGTLKVYSNDLLENEASLLPDKNEVSTLSGPLKYWINNVENTSPMACDIEQYIRQSIIKGIPRTQDTAVLVGTAQSADVILHISAGGVSIDHRGVTLRHLLELPLVKAGDVKDYFPDCFYSLARFHDFISLPSTGSSFAAFVDVDLHVLPPLAGLEEEEDQPAGPAVRFENGEAVIRDHRSDKLYAIVLKNRTDIPLFPYVIWFDPETISIRTFWSPTDHMDAPLLPRRWIAEDEGCEESAPDDGPGRWEPGHLQLGRSPECHDAMWFELEDGQMRNTGILKVFLAQEAMPLDLIEQDMVFGPSSTGSPRFEASESLADLCRQKALTGSWDVVTKYITIVLK